MINAVSDCFLSKNDDENEMQPPVLFPLKSAWGLRSWSAFQVQTPQVQEQVSCKSLHKMGLP